MPMLDNPFREEILAVVQPEPPLVLPEAINDAVLCSVMLLQASVCLQALWLYLHWTDVQTCFLVLKTFLFRIGSKANCQNPALSLCQYLAYLKAILPWRADANLGSAAEHGALCTVTAQQCPRHLAAM